MSNVVALREREDPHGPLPEGAGEVQGELLPEVSLDMQRLLASGCEVDDIPVSKWGKILGDLLDTQVAAFRRRGYDEAESRRLAQAAILAMAELMGGKNWYFPNGDDFRVFLRDIEIARRANRDNIEVLAREYRLTPRSIYRIILEQRRVYVARRQGQLPFEGASEAGKAT